MKKMSLLCTRRDLETDCMRGQNQTKKKRLQERCVSIVQYISKSVLMKPLHGEEKAVCTMWTSGELCEDMTFNPFDFIA